MIAQYSVIDRCRPSAEPLPKYSAHASERAEKGLVLKTGNTLSN